MQQVQFSMMLQMMLFYFFVLNIGKRKKFFCYEQSLTFVNSWYIWPIDVISCQEIVVRVNNLNNRKVAFTNKRFLSGLFWMSAVRKSLVCRKFMTDIVRKKLWETFPGRYLRWYSTSNHWRRKCFRKTETSFRLLPFTIWFELLSPDRSQATLQIVTQSPSQRQFNYERFNDV